MTTWLWTKQMGSQWCGNASVSFAFCRVTILLTAVPLKPGSPFHCKFQNWNWLTVSSCNSFSSVLSFIHSFRFAESSVLFLTVRPSTVGREIFVMQKLMWCYYQYCCCCRAADKSLARPGRKQANVSVRMAWISFGALPCRKKKLMAARVSMLLKSRALPDMLPSLFLSRSG